MAISGLLTLYYRLQKTLISLGCQNISFKLYDLRGGEPNDEEYEEEWKEANKEG